MEIIYPYGEQSLQEKRDIFCQEGLNAVLVMICLYREKSHLKTTVQGLIMRNKIVICIFLLGAAVLLRGAPSRHYQPEIEVYYAPKIPFSACLSDAVWKKSAVYPFMRSVGELSDFYKSPWEGGKLRLLYDDEYLYIGAQLQDSEVLSDGKKNQDFLYAKGDVVEVFLKPADQNYYWEIYGTPHKLTSCFYFPARGMLGLPSGYQDPGAAVKVDARVFGTFNQSCDKDIGWNVLIAIPLADLRKNGMKFVPEEKWTIFVARYNYSRYLPACEFSGVPQKFADFHVLGDYARLIIKR